MQNASRYFLSVKNNAFSLLCTLIERNFWHLSLTVRKECVPYSQFCGTKVCLPAERTGSAFCAMKMTVLLVSPHVSASLDIFCQARELVWHVSTGLSRTGWAGMTGEAASVWPVPEVTARRCWLGDRCSR